MGTLNITEIKKDEAEQLNNFDISLKVDGCLMYFIDGKLFSPRCERTERFKHIADILIKNNFPNCIGEMFLDEYGSCVFDVSKRENWKKCRFMPFDLIDSKNNKEIYNMNYEERKFLLDKLVSEIDNFIKPVKRFETFKEGWEFVLKNNSEGLVLRNNEKWFKCKLLQNTKMEIVAHEVGSTKGTFILKNGNRISGTSEQIVIQYLDIKKRGNKAIAEISYPFITKDNKFFQPRLTNLIEVEK